MTAPATTSYWFHQLQSFGQFDLLQKGGMMVSTPHGLEIKVGDILFIWIGGTDAGLKGWGVVGPASRPTSSSGATYSFEPHLGLEKPIPRSELVSFPGLSDVPLLRGSQTGVYFRLSAEQAFGLSDFLRNLISRLLMSILRLCSIRLHDVQNVNS